VHPFELTLARVEGQKSVQRLKRIPTPSHLNDWLLRETRIEAARRAEGDRIYMEWKFRREADKLDREQWQKLREFETSVGPIGDTGGERRSSVQLELPSKGGDGYRIKDSTGDMSPDAETRTEEATSDKAVIVVIREQYSPGRGEPRPEASTIIAILPRNCMALGTCPGPSGFVPLIDPGTPCRA